MIQDRVLSPSVLKKGRFCHDYAPLYVPAESKAEGRAWGEALPATKDSAQFLWMRQKDMSPCFLKNLP